MQDVELLREYLKNGSEAAFSELVKRYVDFVYSTARRQIGDAHLAQEIAQTVFCLLARKAASLTGCATLAGWLYRATCFTAAKTLRTEKRRRQREQEAATMNQLDSIADGTWEHLSPMLDSALNELGEKDRLAVLLRFFQRKPMREVGEILGVSEDAAKMRVSRAVEQLRKFFAKRGVACSATGLGILLTERSVEAAPAAMASGITTGVLSGAAVSTLSFIQVLTFMAQIKAKILLVAGMGTIAVFTAGLHLYNSARNATHDANRISQIADKARAEAGRANSNANQPVFVAMKTPASSSSGPDLSKAIEELRYALHNSPPKDGVSSYPSEEVMRAISHFGSARKEAFPVLKEAVSDSDVEVRKLAVSAMGEVGGPEADYMPGEPASDAKPFLWTIFAETNELSPFALTSLQNIGLEAKDISPLAEVMARMKIDDFMNPPNSPELIAQIIQKDPANAEPFISSVENLLDSEDAGVRFEAARALAKYEGLANPKISEALLAGLKGTTAPAVPAGTTEFQAMRTLRTLGPDAQSMLPAISSLTNRYPDLREAAFETMAAINPDLRNTVPEVDQVLKEDEAVTFWSQKWASGTYSYQDLLEALKVPSQTEIAAKHLGEMGPSAAEAVPSLIAALAGRETPSRNRIVEAIHQIDPNVTISKVDSGIILDGMEAARQVFRAMPRGEHRRSSILFLQKNERINSAWWTQQELAALADKLAAQDQDAYRAFTNAIIEKDPSLKDVFKSLPQE